MATVTVPTSQTLSSYVERIQLDGEFYDLDFDFNSRMGSWFVSIFDVDGNLLAGSRRCVVDNDLVFQFHHVTEMFPGVMTVFDTSQRQAPAVIDDFGSRVLMLDHDESEGLL